VLALVALMAPNVASADDGGALDARAKAYGFTGVSGALVECGIVPRRARSDPKSNCARLNADLQRERERDEASQRAVASALKRHSQQRRMRDAAARALGRTPQTIMLGDATDYVEQLWGKPEREFNGWCRGAAPTNSGSMVGSNAVHIFNGRVETIHTGK
jgi:hypothetical protein